VDNLEEEASESDSEATSSAFIDEDFFDAESAWSTESSSS